MQALNVIYFNFFNYTERLPTLRSIINNNILLLKKKFNVTAIEFNEKDIKKILIDNNLNFSKRALESDNPADKVYIGDEPRLALMSKYDHCLYLDLDVILKPEFIDMLQQNYNNNFIAVSVGRDYGKKLNLQSGDTLVNNGSFFYVANKHSDFCNFYLDKYSQINYFINDTDFYRNNKNNLLEMVPIVQEDYVVHVFTSFFEGLVRHLKKINVSKIEKIVFLESYHIFHIKYKNVLYFTNVEGNPNCFSMYLGSWAGYTGDPETQILFLKDLGIIDNPEIVKPAVYRITTLS